MFYCIYWDAINLGTVHLNVTSMRSYTETVAESAIDAYILRGTNFSQEKTFSASIILHVHVTLRLTMHSSASSCGAALNDQRRPRYT